ncbi:unnamed protein product [Larinioides sclopetarius]|uniref:Sulfotransferase domain-containing protein n=1 Tax=Larinioides sclopetarius TaxID=280406 RepID=A0AAV1YT85_9ARAC
MLPAMSNPNKEKVKKPKLPFYQVVDGFRIPGYFSIEAFKSALAYKPRSDDLLIVTYPKCGTTWVQNIIGCIFREGKPFSSAIEFFTEAPFLELTGAEVVEKMKRPGVIKFHLPYHITPWSPEAKYIFVARNPKDCCVSFYHHTKNASAYGFTDGEFDDFFELFINEQTDFGDYFETTLSWWEHRNDPNVLFITYEELKEDTAKNVLKIASFIGSEYKEKLEKDDKMLQDVILHSSFNFLKEHLNRHIAEIRRMPKEMIRDNPDIPDGFKAVLLSEERQKEKNDSRSTFIRKGIVGDWQNYFSPAQSAKLEKKFKEKFAGTGLLDLWKNYI